MSHGFDVVSTTIVTLKSFPQESTTHAKPKKTGACSALHLFQQKLCRLTHDAGTVWINPVVKCLCDEYSGLTQGTPDGCFCKLGVLVMGLHNTKQYLESISGPLIFGNCQIDALPPLLGGRSFDKTRRTFAS